MVGIRRRRGGVEVMCVDISAPKTTDKGKEEDRHGPPASVLVPSRAQDGNQALATDYVVVAWLFLRLAHSAPKHQNHVLMTTALIILSDTHACRPRALATSQEPSGLQLCSRSVCLVAAGEAGRTAALIFPPTTALLGTNQPCLDLTTTNTTNTRALCCLTHLALQARTSQPTKPRRELASNNPTTFFLPRPTLHTPAGVLYLAGITSRVL